VRNYGDMTDGRSLIRVRQDVRPHVVYHRAAQDHEALPFEEWGHPADSAGLGRPRLPEAIRSLRITGRALLPGVHVDAARARGSGRAQRRAGHGLNGLVRPGAVA